MKDKIPEQKVIPHSIPFFEKAHITPYGIGKLTYAFIISEGSIDFTLNVNPESSADFIKKEPYKFEQKYTVAQDSISFILNDIEQHFLTCYPDSENYFNQIQCLQSSIQHHQKEFTLQERRMDGFFMTNNNIRTYFKLAGNELKQLIDKIEFVPNPTSSCQIL